MTMKKGDLFEGVIEKIDFPKRGTDLLRAAAYIGFVGQIALKRADGRPGFSRHIFRDIPQIVSFAGVPQIGEGASVKSNATSGVGKSACDSAPDSAAGSGDPDCFSLIFGVHPMLSSVRAMTFS